MRATPALPAARVSAIVRRSSGCLRRLERGDHAVEVVAVGAQHFGDRGRVRGEDLHPELGVAAGDAGRVAQPLAGEADGGVARRAQPGGEQRGDELRHVRHERDAAIVLVRRHLHGRRARGRARGLRARGAARGVVASCGRDDPRATEEQVGARGDRSPALAPGHRVRTEVARDVGTGLDELREDARLDARDIRDERVRMRGELGRDDRGDRVGRHRDDHESRGIIRRGGASRAVVDRQSQVRARRVGEDHVDAALAQRQADARAEQAGADDADRSAHPCTHAVLTRGRRRPNRTRQARRIPPARATA